MTKVQADNWITIKPTLKKRVPHRPTKAIESKKIKAKKRSERKAALRLEIKEEI